jgi:hypothetical protein
MSVNKKLRWAAVLGGVGFLGLLVSSTMQQKQFRYEVCVTFNGRTHCATADGPTPEEAIRTAQTIGCSLLTDGRDENILCLDRAPASSREISRP